MEPSNSKDQQNPEVKTININEKGESSYSPTEQIVVEDNKSEAQPPIIEYTNSSNNDESINKEKNKSSDEKKQARKQKDGGAPKIAIAIAILVAIALAITSVFAFSSLNESENNPATNQTQPSSDQATGQQNTGPVTPDEVDQTVNQIEEEINKVGNDEDLPTSDSVSDNTLGIQ